MSRKVQSLERINSIRETNETFYSLAHINGCFPALLMSNTCQNFRLFLVTNLSFLNFRFFLLMYPGSVTDAARHCGGAALLPLVEVVQRDGWAGLGFWWAFYDVHCSLSNVYCLLVVLHSWIISTMAQERIVTFPAARRRCFSPVVM